GDAIVPGHLYRKGQTGAGAADDLIKAMGGTQAAEEALGDYPAMVLRDMAMKSGSFDPKGYQRFLNSFGPALAKFPGVARRFQTIAEAQRQVEGAALRGQARIEAFEDSAASHYLGKGGEATDPGKAIAGLLNSDNVGAAFRDV